MTPAQKEEKREEKKKEGHLVSYFQLQVRAAHQVSHVQFLFIYFFSIHLLGIHFYFIIEYLSLQFSKAQYQHKKLFPIVKDSKNINNKI
jgi:hypothetical protein